MDNVIGKTITLNSLWFALAWTLSCNIPEYDLKDEIITSFQFVKTDTDTTYIIYDIGNVVMDTLPAHYPENVILNIEATIHMEQQTVDWEAFYHSLNNSRTVYTAKNDTVYVCNILAFNPDGGNPEVTILNYSPRSHRGHREE